MSSLLDSLSSASTSLNAQRMGLDVAGQNLANVNTVGYSREVLNLAEIPSSDPNNVGGGVQIVGVSASRDPFIDSRVRTESQGVQYDTAIVNGLAEVQAAVGQPGSSIDGALTNFFDAFATLAQDPTSGSARATVVAQGQALASSFSQMSAEFSGAQTAADQTVRADVDQVNTLSQQVATLNGQILAAGNTNVDSLVDQRNVDLGQLTDLTGGTAVTQSDGSMDVTIGSGHALVVGDAAFALTVSSAPVTGVAQIQSSDGADVTGEITGGQMGGLLNVRDTLLPNYQTQLDNLAYDVSTQVNSLHEAGFGSTGGTGQDFFTPLASATGAASSLQVDPAVVADPGLVAASSTGTVGDNGTAQAISNLRNADVTVGGTATPTDGWAELTYRIGADAANAQTSQTTGQNVLTQLQTLQQSVSGVSVDEETASLMKFQMAYEASARYFVTVNDTLTAFMTAMGV